MPDNQYVTTQQAAVMLGIVDSAVRHLLTGKKPKLRGKKWGNTWMVDLQSIAEYLANPPKKTGRPKNKRESAE